VSWRPIDLDGGFLRQFASGALLGIGGSDLMRPAVLCTLAAQSLHTHPAGPYEWPDALLPDAQYSVFILALSPGAAAGSLIGLSSPPCPD
jgi:hypothetical protein